MRLLRSSEGSDGEAWFTALTDDTVRSCGVKWSFWSRRVLVFHRSAHVFRKVLSPVENHLQVLSDVYMKFERRTKSLQLDHLGS